MSVRSVPGSARDRVGGLAVRLQRWLLRSLQLMHLLLHLRHALSHALRHHPGWKHCLVVVGKLGSIGVLLGIGVGDGLVESASHGDMVGEICRQPAVEVCRSGLKMGGESSVLERKVVVLLFVHLLIDNILLGHT